MMRDPAVEEAFVFGHRYPERTIVYETIARLSVEARAGANARCDLAYGEGEREKFDLFPAGDGGPLVVFIHGGYWRSQDRRNYNFVAGPLNRAGVSVAVPGYPIAPGATMATIVASLRDALIWLCDEGGSHGLGTGPVYLAGHSAGGHLAALLAIESARDAVMPPVAGVCAISGLFDLAPILGTSINADVGMSVVDAARFSPLSLPPGAGWLISAYGEAETAPFIDQSHRYAARWAETGRDAVSLPMPGRNHYDVLLDLVASDSVVLPALLDRIAADRAADPIGGKHVEAAVRQL